MGGSWRIGRLAGIDIYVHFTFMILVGWIAVSQFFLTGSLVGAAVGVLLIAAVFGIVVLHELGHALAARSYGIPTRDITLLPIGGVARLERMPEKPTQELVVALAGPAVNVALAGILGAVLLFQGDFIGLPEFDISLTGNLLWQLFKINLWLAVFNMIPAFPMDGGRVLRALLAMRLPRPRATDIAAKIGRGLAAVGMAIGFAGLIGVVDASPMLLLVSIFVWIGAGAEAQAVRASAGLSGTVVSDLMIREFAATDPDEPLETVAQQAMRGFQQDFPVVADGRVVGLLSRGDIMTGLMKYHPGLRVADVMRREFPTVAPDEPAESALRRLAEGPSVLPVVQDGHLIGLLTADNVGEYVSLRQAVDRGHRDRHWDWSRA